jgi:probable F420-dependent oxidoreductase
LCDSRQTVVMTMKIGVQFHPQGTTVAEMRRAWEEADAMGVDSMFMWDHFYPLYGDPEASHFECWSLLSAMAATTSKAKFGALVTPVSYRNVDLTADMARTVDHISNGRLILGLGAGWFERDYNEYGYEFGTPVSRLKAFGEALPRLKARLAKLNPAPIGDLPILIGGTGEKVTLRLVARHAQMWNVVGSDAKETKRLNGVIDHWCEVEGTDPAAIERTALVMGDVNIDEWADAGITHLIFGQGHPFDLAPVAKLLAAR